MNRKDHTVPFLVALAAVIAISAVSHLGCSSRQGDPGLSQQRYIYRTLRYPRADFLEWKSIPGRIVAVTDMDPFEISVLVEQEEPR